MCAFVAKSNSNLFSTALIEHWAVFAAGSVNIGLSIEGTLFAFASFSDKNFILIRLEKLFSL